MMIQLEPIPNKRGMLLSEMGESTPDGEYEQTLQFPVRVVKHRYAYGRSVTRLATGEELEDLFGEVALYRGKKQMDDGQPFPDAIFYVEPFAGDDEVPPSSAAFEVDLYLDPKLFDQIVTLCHASRLPWVSLDFGFRAPITYGNSPDGSNKVWDNKEHSTLNIAGATVAIPLTDQKNEEDDGHRAANYENVTKELLDRYHLLSCGEKLSKYLQLPSNCETRKILDTVTNMSSNHSSDGEEFRSKMEEAIYFVELMHDTLNPSTGDNLHAAFLEDWKKLLPDYYKSTDPYSWIWFHRNPTLAFLDGKESGNYWPLDREKLAEVCREYISKSWLHCPKIDKILIDAMVYNETLGFGEQIKPFLLKTGFVDAKRFALNNQLSFNKSQLKKILMDGLRSLLFIIGSAIVGFGAAESHGWWAGLFVGFGLWVLIKINYFVEEKTDTSKIVDRDAELLFEMQNTSEMMTNYYISPTYLKERLIITANKGAVWPTEVFPILEMAIARSPSGKWY